MSTPTALNHRHKPFNYPLALRALFIESPGLRLANTEADRATSAA